MADKIRVLYVDDDERALRTVERSLREYQSQWNLAFANSGEAALKCLQDGHDYVLVTDWMMPGISGLDLCQRVREQDAQGQSGYTYILLLTGKQEITSIVEALEAGADDFLSKPYDQRELIARVRAGIRIVELHQRLRESNEKLVVLATTDGMTGLLNRRRGREILDENLLLLKRGKQDLSVILIDLDRFKGVNDTYGHEAGDTLIKTVAARLRDACRQYDSVVRWGGDEFVVICPHTDGNEVAVLAERIRSKMADEPVSISREVTIDLTISVGASSAARGSTVDALVLLGQADDALYSAKAGGRNRVEGRLL
ncbi:MAG: diguanylate cyclase [Candidatus Hydrogenedentes bacterium]|nr:diguanylate cyclase [Candidatus Hydrogenedentota bacterium]